MLKALLNDIIDENVDSLRLYYLGNKYQTKVEHFGVDRGMFVTSISTNVFVALCMGV